MTERERAAAIRKHGRLDHRAGWETCPCVLAQRIRAGGLFDLAEGRALKAEGQARAEAMSPDDWRAAIDGIIARRAATGATFTADDVRADAIKALVPPAHHPNAWGPRFTAAAKAGLIAKIPGPPVPSRQVQNHACTIPLWVGRNGGAH